MRKNILVMRFSAMGDVIMTVPVVANVVDKHDVNVTMLTREAFSPVFSGLKHVSVISPDLNGKYKGLPGIWKLFRGLKKSGQWDAVIDLHDVLRTKILRFLFRLSGVKVSVINKNRAGKKALTRKTDKVLRQLPPVQHEYAEAFGRVGLPVEAAPCQHYLKNTDLPAEIIEIAGQKKGKWIGIAPFAKHAAKMYPQDKMEKIIAAFSVRGNTTVFLFGGGKHEVDILSGWAGKYANVTSLAGKIKLKDELAIMAHMDCMLSMDSANLHLANLVNVPVVSVWGATHPYAGFLSMGNTRSKQIQLTIDCRPCSVFGNKLCYKGTNECMNIEPAKIIETIEQIIE